MDPLQRGRIGQVSVQAADGQQQGQMVFPPDFLAGFPYHQNPLQHFAGNNGQFMLQQPNFDQFTNGLFDANNNHQNINGQPFNNLSAQEYAQRYALNQQQLHQFLQPQQLPQQPNPNAAAFRVSSQPANVNPTHSPYFQPSTQPLVRPSIFTRGEKWTQRVLSPQESAATLDFINNAKIRALFEEDEDAFVDGDNSAQHKPKRARTEKDIPKQEPVVKQRPTDPLEALRYDAEGALDDSGAAADQVAKYNEIAAKAETVPQRRVIVEVLENARAESIAAYGKIRYLPLTFQRWLVNAYNTHKSAIAGKDDAKVDPETDHLVNIILKVLIMMDIKTTDLEKFKLDKVASTLIKKWPSEGTKQMARNLVDKAKKLERQAAKTKEREGSEPKDSLKRKSEDEDSSSTKRIASGPSTALSTNANAASTASKPSSTPATAPQQNGPGTVKKPGQFFKALQQPTKPSAPAAPQKSGIGSVPTIPTRETKPAAPAPAPASTASTSTSTSTFSSIFDQLKERQKKDEETKTKRTDNGKPEEPRKKKVKKSVAWKNEADLVEVKLFEVLEPEGEYYGGGMSDSHEWGDARGLDVAEGRDAKEALRNRNVLDDEEEELLDWYTPIAIDASELFDGKDLSIEHQPLKRLGEKLPDGEEAKVQAAREAGILSVTYYSVRDIPFSPEEPENDGNSGPHDPNKPIIMKLSDAPAPTAGFDNLLAQFNPQEAAPQPAVDTNPAAAILQTLQAFNPAAQQQQQQQPVAAVNPLGSLLASLVGVQAGAAPQAQAAPAVDFNALLASLAQPQQQQQQQPADGIAALLATIAGGAAPPMPQQPMQQQQHQQHQHQNSWDEHDRGSNNRWDQQSSRDVRRELREKSGWTEDHENRNSTNSDWKQRKPNEKKKPTGKNSKKGSRPCQFFSQGKCRMGEDCRFAHTYE